MKRSTIALLVRLYPEAWRTRFGIEFEELLAEEEMSLGVVFDIFRAAMVETLFNPSGIGVAKMQEYPKSVLILIRRPSGYLPIAMSMLALALVLGVLTFYGSAPAADEGAAAHIFQILIVAQLPILAYFTFKWLARERSAALSVLAIQVAAVALAVLPIWALGW